MVIDTSAIVAILFGEAEAEAFAEAIEAAPVRAMSMASALEATIVIESELGAEGGRELDGLLHTIGISIEPITTEQLAAARHAFRNFGTGRHPAARRLLQLRFEQVHRRAAAVQGPGLHAD